jgi:hypothetical protein
MLLRALENEEGMNFFELLYVFRNYFLDQSFYAMCHRPKSISIFQTLFFPFKLFTIKKM